MGRRVRLDTLAAAPVEDVPGHSAATLVRLRTSQLAPTPLNPRQDFGSGEELAELGESLRTRQLQPVVAVSRAAYLKLWPEHHDRIGSVDFVLVNGERRYRSAVHVGLDTLDALIREEVADSRAAFLDALLSENLDRKNFDPIEEAHAVEAMVQECGSARAAAAQFRRHESWVSQRRALLKLTPELQQQVRAGELSVRIARSLAALPPDQQEAAWRQARAEQAEKAQQRAQARRAAAVAALAAGTDTGGGAAGPAAAPPAPAGVRPTGLSPASADAGGGAAGPAAAAGRGATSVATSAAAVSIPPVGADPGESVAPAAAGVQDGTSTGAVFTAVKTAEPPPHRQEPVTESLPWGSPEALALLIRQRMTPAHRRVLVTLLAADEDIQQPA